MTDGRRELIRYRMARAREALDEANLLLAHAHVHTAVNRIYHACFDAVSALLLTEGQSSSKHSGVRALFDRLWIGPERLPREMAVLPATLRRAAAGRLHESGHVRPSRGASLV